MELVVLLAVLLGGAICVWHLAGLSARGTYDDLANHLATGSGPADPSHHQQPVDLRPDESVCSIRDGITRTTWVTAWVALLTTGSLGWLLFRRARRKRDQAANDPRQGEDVLASVPAERQNQLFQKRQRILKILSRQPMSLLKNRVEVRQLMTRDLMTVLPQTPVEKLAEATTGRKMRHLLVCDRAGRLLGIISDRDLGQRSGQTAADLMTPNPSTVSSRTAVGPAITMLLDKHISCLPVVDDGAVCGVLTTTDLMMSLQCTLQILTTLATELQSPPEPQEAACT